MILKTKKFVEQRQPILERYREIGKIEDELEEGKSLPAELNEESERLWSEILPLTKTIERIENLEKLDFKEEEKILQQAEEQKISNNEVVDKQKRHTEAFNDWIVNGDSASVENMTIVHQGGVDRAQSTTVGAGGYTIPVSMAKSIEAAMLAYGGVESVATVLNHDSGEAFHMPMYDDTSEEAALLAENTATNEQDMTFTELILNAYKYTSNLIRSSSELIQDSAFDISSTIGTALGERIARKKNRTLTTDNGTSKPKGCVVAADLGVSAASGTAVTANEIIDLKHTVDVAYRNKSTYMFNDSTLKAVTKLVDSNNQYIWQPGLAVGNPATLLGHPFVINQHMASIGASAKFMLFGNFKKYIVRNVRPFRLLRLSERYAEYDQIGFVGFVRWDGDLLNAGTNPLKYMRNAAT